MLLFIEFQIVLNHVSSFIYQISKASLRSLPSFSLRMNEHDLKNKAQYESNLLYFSLIPNLKNDHT